MGEIKRSSPKKRNPAGNEKAWQTSTLSILVEETMKKVARRNNNNKNTRSNKREHIGNIKSSLQTKEVLWKQKKGLQQKQNHDKSLFDPICLKKQKKKIWKKKKKKKVSEETTNNGNKKRWVGNKKKMEKKIIPSSLHFIPFSPTQTARKMVNGVRMIYGPSVSMSFIYGGE